MPERPGDVFAVRLDGRGVVLDVVADSLPLGVGVGRPIAELAPRAERGKVHAFFAELKLRGAAGGWLVHPAAEGIPIVALSGCRAGDTFTLIATRADTAPAANPNVLNELSRVNNELSSLQRELARSNRDLQAQRDEKNRLLAMASHDIRSPMTAIFGYVDLLARQLKSILTPKQDEQLARVRRNAASVLRLIDDLLEASRSDDPTFQFKPSTVQVGPVLDHVCTSLSPGAARKDVTLVLKPDCSGEHVQADRGRLEQALVNLVSNAVKFSPQGSTVTMGATCDGPNITFYIIDNGPGVPSEDRERIFEAFASGSSRPTGGESSTGLGLAIVRQVAVMHGGRVWVDDAPGGGAAFYLTLPLAPQESSETVE